MGPLFLSTKKRAHHKEWHARSDYISNKKLFLFLLLKSLYERLVETLEDAKILGSHLITLLKKIQLATLVSLQHTAVTANLTLVVPCHQRICLNRILTDIRKGTKLLHEHVEHRIVMTPVVLTQPEPLEMILLLQCHQMLPQLVNLHALLHLLLSKSYQRCRIYIQLNLVRQRGALNLNAPTVIPVLDERRIRVHQ